MNPPKQPRKRDDVRSAAHDSLEKRQLKILWKKRATANRLPIEKNKTEEANVRSNPQERPRPSGRWSVRPRHAATHRLLLR